MSVGSQPRRAERDGERQVGDADRFGFASLWPEASGRPRSKDARRGLEVDRVANVVDAIQRRRAANPQCGRWRLWSERSERGEVRHGCLAVEDVVYHSTISLARKAGSRVTDACFCDGFQRLTTNAR